MIRERERVYVCVILSHSLMHTPLHSQNDKDNAAEQGLVPLGEDDGDDTEGGEAARMARHMSDFIVGGPNLLHNPAKPPPKEDPMGE